MAEKFDVLKYTKEENNINAVKSVLIVQNRLLNASLNSLATYQFFVSLFTLGIDFEYFENPEVSIVIPVKNEYDMTQFLLNSIYSQTQNITYEIIIADDNSIDKTKEIQNTFKNITVIKNDIKTPGFVHNVSKAIKFARGKYILLLNNDMFVLDNYLEELLKVIKKYDDIGIVGSKNISLDGKIIECGVKLRNDGNVAYIGNEQNNEYLDEEEYIDCDYCSGCSILFEKSLWEKSGGFDKNLAPAYYEDSDFALNIKYNFGLKSVCVPRSKIYHFKGITYEKEVQTKMDSTLKNKEYFLNKWNKYLPK